MRRDWKAKLASLIIAIAVWYVIREQENSTLPAGGGSSWYEEPRVISQEQHLALQSTVCVEEPSWLLWGNYVGRQFVFDPNPASSPTTA